MSDVSAAAAIPLPPTPAKAPTTAAAPVTPARSAARSAPPSPVIARARAAGTRAQELVGTAAARAAEVRRHPAAARVEAAAARQVAHARDALGRSEFMLAAEQATGVDRVPLGLLFVGIFIVFVMFNLFGFAIPVAGALAMASPTYQTVRILNKGGDDATVKNILVYFIVLGSVQTLESLMGGLLERNIPRYHTLKLLILFYLAHAKWKGAAKVYDLIWKKSAARGVPHKTISTNFAGPSGDSDMSSPPTTAFGADGRNGFVGSEKL